MSYLHGQNVVHRDLACRNLLVKREDDDYLVKVSDFGLSEKGSSADKGGALLPIKWCAPEVLKKVTNGGTAKSDVW